MDVSSRPSVQALVKTATSFGEIYGVIHAAGVSPLMGRDGTFITSSDFLMDGGVTASYWYGELASKP